jgi:hypothetical protein
MNSTRANAFVLLVWAVLFSCAGYGQSMQAQELEAYRRNLHEQVSAGKLTAKEADTLYSQKQDQINRQVGTGKTPPDPGTGNPALNCQTYPDGRTECR